MELHFEEVEEHWTGSLHNALVVSKMEACDGSWRALFYHSHVGGEFILPCAELVEDAVDLMYVKTFRGLGDAVYLSH